MDRNEYSRILDSLLNASAKKLNLKNIFLNDNDPKHTSKYVKKYLVNKNFVLDWSAQSLDLNPIDFYGKFYK